LNTVNHLYSFVRGSDVANNNDIMSNCISKDIYDKYYKNSNCIVKTGDILVSACSKNFNFKLIPKSLNNSPYHGCVRFTNFKNIDAKYIISYLNIPIIKNNLLNSQRGSTVGFTNTGDYINLTIKILKPSIMTKHKLQQLFEEVDTLKDALEADKLEYQTQLKSLFKDFELVEDEEQIVENGDEEEQLNNEYDTNEDLEDELEQKSLNTKRPKNNIKIDDNVSNKSNTSSKSNTSNSSSSTSSKVIIATLNGVKCVREDDKYYLYENNIKGDLYAFKNDNGDVELVEQEESETENKYDYLTIGKMNYILIGEKVYTVNKNNEPEELYGTYKNDKFTKLTSKKIIVKGRLKKSNIDDLEAGMDA